MRISEAERKIAAILAQLETEGGVVVRSIRLDTIETTTFGDDRKQFQQLVDIEVERLPGNNWAT